MNDELKVYRRNLPHWELPGGIYFITFRTADNETLIDEAKNIIFSAIKYHVGKLYTLYGSVVMNNHVHIILQPNEVSTDVYFGMAHIMHSIKSYSANRIQKTLNKIGSIWQNENYDRIIRTDSDFVEKMNYIIYNPVKAGLVTEPDEYRWLYYQAMEE